MVLYEDLRVYTMWRTEMAQYKQQSLHYKKSAEEWEILGELAERLHHPDEAVEAYVACLDIRFSPKAMKGLLALHYREGDVRSMVSALIRLIAWQYRWYSEVSRPSPQPQQPKPEATIHHSCPPVPNRDHRIILSITSFPLSFSSLSPRHHNHMTNRRDIICLNNSSLRTCSSPSASSSRTKGPSRCAASCRPPVCLSPS